MVRPLWPNLKNGHNGHASIILYGHEYRKVRCLFDHNHKSRSLLKFEVDWICYKKVMAKTKFMSIFTSFPLYFSLILPRAWGTPKTCPIKLKFFLVALRAYTNGINSLLKYSETLFVLWDTLLLPLSWSDLPGSSQANSYIFRIFWTPLANLLCQ